MGRKSSGYRAQGLSLYNINNYNTFNMNTFEVIKKNFPRIKMGMKTKYPQLTESDLTIENAYANEFMKNLELKTGKSQETLLEEMNLIATKDEQNT